MGVLTQLKSDSFRNHHGDLTKRKWGDLASQKNQPWGTTNSVVYVYTIIYVYIYILMIYHILFVYTDR
jgi:hypothetical protein